MTAPARDVASLGERWELVVGLEVHVQLRTRTKIFCRCSTDFGAPPNVNTCPVCLALPGALPVLNEDAVRLAVQASLGLGCTVHETSVFARKNYFYPDLPKGYQISQFDRPLATEGALGVGERADGSTAVVRITRIHMEEDAGKSIHDRYAGWTAIDLNRSGVPLVEIVSEPDIRSAAEAGAYVRALRQILEYLDVSDVNMEEGSLRVDANVSVRPRGEARLGIKTEVKNMNSISGLERAIDAEFARQCAILEAGGRVEQQTLLWDADAGTVRPARAKEGSHDYRYFPDPDLPPLCLAPEWIEAQRCELPELPAARRERYRRVHAGLSERDVDVLTASPSLGDYFEETALAAGDARAAANWVRGTVLNALNETGQGIAAFAVRPADLGALIRLVADGVVSNTAGKQVFQAMLAGGGPPAQIIAEQGLAQVSDDAQLAGWVDEVLAEHPQEAERFARGEKRLLGVLVGYAMKKSKGKADPRRLNQLLSERAGGT